MVKEKGLFLLMVTSITVSVGLEAVTPIQPLFMVDVGATELDVGLIFAVSSLLGLASRIPLGILSDRMGRHLMILITSILQFVILVLFSIANNMIWFYPLMALQAMIWAFFGPSAVSLASDVASPDKMGRVIGLYYTSLGLGQFIGPLLTSILTEYLTYRKIFLILSILPAVGLFATLRGKSMRRDKNQGEREKRPESQRIVDSFKRILKSRNMIGLCLSRITFSVPIGIINALFSVWAKSNLLFTPSMISILFSARGAANTSIRLPIGGVVDKFGKKKPILLAFFLTFLAFIIFSATGNYTLILIAMAIFGLSWGMRIIPDTAILTESVELRDRGLALATLMSMFAMGSSVGSFMAGVTYNAFSMSTIFQISAGVLFLGLVIIAITIKERR